MRRGFTWLMLVSVTPLICMFLRIILFLRRTLGFLRSSKPGCFRFDRIGSFPPLAVLWSQSSHQTGSHRLDVSAPISKFIVDTEGVLNWDGDPKHLGKFECNMWRVVTWEFVNMGFARFLQGFRFGLRICWLRSHPERPVWAQSCVRHTLIMTFAAGKFLLMLQTGN